MIQLDQIKIASPCTADWESMTGTDQARFCGQCRKNVYNLSEMTRDDAQRVVEEHEGRLCVRFYTRVDGTMLTQDCPVGLHAVRYRRVKKFSYAAAVLLSCGVGLVRGASAVTKTAKTLVPVVKAHPKSLRVKPVRPTAMLGRMVMPSKPLSTMGDVSGPTAGMPTVGEPTMGKLLIGAPRPPK